MEFNKSITIIITTSILLIGQITENIPLDDDAIIIQNLLEEEFDNQETLEILAVRLRIAPNIESEKWYNKLNFNNNKYAIMLRSDYKSPGSSNSITGYAIRGNWRKFSIIAGTFKTEIGQGLLYSSEYGRIKSSNNIFSPVKSTWGVKQNSSSTAIDGSIGVAIQYNTNNFSSSVICENKDSYTYLARIGNRDKHFGITSNFHSEKFSAGSSFWKLEKLGYFFSGEIGVHNTLNAYITSVGFNTRKNKWMISYRYLPENWSTVTGRPYSAFYRDKNETGILLSVYQKVNNISISSWLDLYKELQFIANEPMKIGYDFYISSKIPFDSNKSISLSYREKEKNALVTVDIQNITHQIWTANLIRIGKLQMVMPIVGSIKFIYSTIHSEIKATESGYLLSKDFDFFKTANIEYSVNIIYYETDSWDSRLYSYTHGLPGEFKIKSFYGNGSELTHLLQMNIGKNTYVGLKYNHNLINKQSTNLKTDITIQIDYKI